ncbi:hypothetical protein [uncultured Pseudokineococcus sp.]|uniref:hypothetical protein n=1 Tax=uncultured Pseudokineococcus sp. TaxID=1642928 RepID=UPI002617C71B|nr:hypothetical protein [uncultured Pseudokineococcus sp.]
MNEPTAPAPDGQGSGAPADRPARALGAYGLLLVGVLAAGLGLGAAVGPLQPLGAQPSDTQPVEVQAPAHDAPHR